VDILVLDALRDEPHETHFTIGEAVAMRSIAPQQTYFTHMTHDLPTREDERAAARGRGAGI
jgi:phosphoribosyl 1,2-cyclic phosphate phosphodiesterase